LISSQANEVCNKHQKNKISPEHLLEALQELGFPDFIDDLKSIGEEISTGRKERSSKKAKKVSGKSEEQLIREQEEKFAAARNRTGSAVSTITENPEKSFDVDEDDEDLDDEDDE
jgi:down-regulator of transcription 1